MPYKNKDKQKQYQRDWVRQKRKGSTGSTRTRIAARIAMVQPSNGTDKDNLRAASDKLLAALGGPAIEPVPVAPKSVRPYTGELTKTRQTSNKGFNGQELA